jgi:TRAP-type C4-dicarboxylate transport system permease small subunit
VSNPSSAEQIGIGVLGLVAILLTCYSTMARYFFPSEAPDWGEEVVVYLCVWGLWLAAGSLARRDAHVRAEFIVHLFSNRGLYALQALHALLGLVFTAAMAYGGMQVVMMSLATGERSASTLAIPLVIYYCGMPVGMGLMLLAYIYRLRIALGLLISNPAQEAG